MSNPDSPESKKINETLPATRSLTNLLHALLDDESGKRYRVTKKERAWLEERQKALDESRIGEPEAKKILEQEEDRFLAIVGRGITKTDIDRTPQMIKRIIDDYEARLDWEAGAEPGWTKKKPPGSGYVM